MALEADLPSGAAATALMRGDARALGPVVGYTLLRAGLIGAGLYAAGQRQGVVRGALAGALAIELWVLGWAAANKDKP